MKENKIKVDFVGKPIYMNEDIKDIYINIVDSLSKQHTKSEESGNTKNTYIFAPNGFTIKGKEVHRDEEYNVKEDKRINIWKSVGCYKIIFEQHQSRCIKSGDKIEHVSIKINPFKIKLDLSQEFKLYKVNNIYQVSKSKIYAPDGFDLYIDNICRANGVKALEYYPYRDLYSYTPHRLAYNSHFDYDSKGEDNRFIINIQNTDAVELRFYE